MKEQISWVVIRACLRCDEFWLAALFFPLQQIRVKIKKKETTHEKEKRIIFKTRQDTRTHATIWACNLWRGKKILFHSPSRCCLLLFFLDVFNKKTAVKNEILCYFLSFLFLDKRSVGDRSCSGAGAYMRMPFRLPQKYKRKKKHNIFSLTPHHHLLNIIWIQFDWNHFDKKKPVFKYSFFTSRCSFFFSTSRASLTFFFGFLACFLVYCKRVSEWERMEKSRTREPAKKRRTRSEYTLFFSSSSPSSWWSNLTTHNSSVWCVPPQLSRSSLPPTYYPSLTHSPPSIPPRYPSFWLALARAPKHDRNEKFYENSGDKKSHLI